MHTRIHTRSSSFVFFFRYLSIALTLVSCLIYNNVISAASASSPTHLASPLRLASFALSLPFPFPLPLSLFLSLSLSLILFFSFFPLSSDCPSTETHIPNARSCSRESPGSIYRYRKRARRDFPFVPSRKHEGRRRHHSRAHLERAAPLRK